MRYKVKDGRTLHYPDGSHWANGGDTIETHDAELMRFLARSSKVVQDGTAYVDRMMLSSEIETRTGSSFEPPQEETETGSL